MTGVLQGAIRLFIMCAYALGFWYGWKLTQNIDPVTGEPEYTVGKILLVFFNIIIAIFSIGQAIPFANNLALARAAAYEIFQIIDRVTYLSMVVHSTIFVDFCFLGAFDQLGIRRGHQTY